MIFEGTLKSSLYIPYSICFRQFVDIGAIIGIDRDTNTNIQIDIAMDIDINIDIK